MCVQVCECFQRLIKLTVRGLQVQVLEEVGVFKMRVLKGFCSVLELDMNEKAYFDLAWNVVIVI